MNNIKGSDEPDTKKRKANDESTLREDSCNKTTQSIGIESFSNDIVIRFASYLCSRDLVSLSLTCRKFGSSNVDGSSLMADTAHQIISDAQQDEKNALPKLVGQTYIELYSELEKYREPRVFDQLIGDRLYYVNNDKSHIRCAGNGNVKDTAICDHVMRAGRHYAKFTIEESLCIGIIKPLKNWDKKGLHSFDPWDRCNQMFDEWDRWGDNINHCSYLACAYSHPGCCYWTSRKEREYRRWNGSESFEKGDEIGMLLDLNVGALSVYRNGRMLGMMKEGLAGEYCWHVSLWQASVRIEKGSIPESSDISKRDE